MRDRRKEQRWPAYLGATISFNRQLSVVDCIVKNTSVAGAKLVFHNTPFVPEEFDLSIPQHNIACRARTCWRHFDAVGVALDSRQAQQPIVAFRQTQRRKPRAQDNAALRWFSGPDDEAG